MTVIPDYVRGASTGSSNCGFLVGEPIRTLGSRKMAVRIRLRTDDDLGECVGLLETVESTDRYPAHWPDDPALWLSPKAMLGAWVAETDGRIVGHVALNAGTADTSASVWSRPLAFRPSNSPRSPGYSSRPTIAASESAAPYSIRPAPKQPLADCIRHSMSSRLTTTRSGSTSRAAGGASTAKPGTPTVKAGRCSTTTSRPRSTSVSNYRVAIPTTAAAGSGRWR